MHYSRRATFRYYDVLFFRWDPAILSTTRTTYIKITMRVTLSRARVHRVMVDAQESNRTARREHADYTETATEAAAVVVVVVVRSGGKSFKTVSRPSR